MNVRMKQFRVLLVDDNPDHRFFIKRALRGVEDVEFSVDAVVDGEEALAFLRGEDQWEDRRLPHMVMLDLRMPRKSGLEVLAEMRDDDLLRAVPVCVLTSSDRPQDVREAFSLGTNSYVVKSGDVEGLRREIRAVSDFWTRTSLVPEPLG